jgi:hypothetical protein
VARQEKVKTIDKFFSLDTSTGYPYILYMNLIFIETPEFIHKIDRIASQDEFHQLQNELISDPLKGKIVKGTGGARKIRMKLKGRGKSGGARTIYYYVDLRQEIWFLDIYLKSDKDELSESEKMKFYRFIKETINAEK